MRAKLAPSSATRADLMPACTSTPRRSTGAPLASTNCVPCERTSGGTAAGEADAQAAREVSQAAEQAAARASTRNVIGELPFEVRDWSQTGAGGPLGHTARSFPDNTWKKPWNDFPDSVTDLPALRVAARRRL